MSGSVKAKPWISNPAQQRIIVPVVIAIILVAVWQLVLTALKVPAYLIPTPLMMFTALVQDWGLLGPSLLFTLKITALSFALSVLIGVLIAFIFVQSRLIELAFFPYVVLLQVTPVVAVAPLIIIWVSNITLAMVVRNLDGGVPDHFQHRVRAAQRLARPAGVLQVAPCQSAASAAEAACAHSVALLFCSPAHLQRFGAHRGGRCRVRRGHRGHQYGPGLSDSPGRLSTQYSANVCRVVPDFRRGHRALCGHVAVGRQGHWALARQ